MTGSRSTASALKPAAPEPPGDNRGPNGRGRPERVLRMVSQWALIGLLALGLFYTLYFARDLFLPFFLAVFFSTLLHPVVRMMWRVRVPEGVSAGMVLLVLVLLFGLGVYQLSEPASDWLARAPEVASRIEAKLSGLRRTIETAQETSQKIEEMAELDGDKKEEKVEVREPSLAERMLHTTWRTLAQAMVTVILVFFLLARGRETLERSVDAIPGEARRQQMRDILQAVREHVATYLRTLSLINLGLGAVTAGVLGLLQVPNPVLWGVAAGLLNFIPYVGPAIMLAILAGVSVITFDSMLEIAQPVAAYLVLTTLEGQLITPTLLGRRLTLNPIAVFASIVVWFWLWGVPGAIMAVPLLASVKIVCDRTPGLERVGAVMG